MSTEGTRTAASLDGDHTAVSSSAGTRLPLRPSRFEHVMGLGAGDVGRVYLVRDRQDNELYALKVFDKAEMERRGKQRRVKTERDILVATNHPFLCTLHHAFQTEERLYFVLQYCAGGDLLGHQWRQPGHRFTEDQARFFAAETLIALEYLHALGIMYRDLKPDNILVHDSGHVMLTDFDLSADTSTVAVQPRMKTHTGPRIHRTKLDKPIIRGFDAAPAKRTSFVGTDTYFAPEVIDSKGYSNSVDWWTWGILVFEMLYGDTPFKGASRSELFQSIQEGKLEFPKQPAVSSAAKSLLKDVLAHDPARRLRGAGQIKRHKWFKSINWALLRNTDPPLVPSISDRARGENFFLDDEDKARFTHQDFVDDPAGVTAVDPAQGSPSPDPSGAGSDADAGAGAGVGAGAGADRVAESESEARVYERWTHWDFSIHGGDRHWVKRQEARAMARAGNSGNRQHVRLSAGVGSGEGGGESSRSLATAAESASEDESKP